MEKDIIAFGSSRKSPDDKESTDVSINNQNQLIKDICYSRNWKLISIEEDRDISGGDRERPGIIKQINQSKSYKVSHPDSEVYIVVKDSKRFARDSSFFRDTLKDLSAYGVKVFSIMNNDFLDYTDIGDRLMSVVDEQMIIDGMKNAEITQKLKISKKLPCIPAPFGYKYNKEKSWSIVKKQSYIILGVVQNYLNLTNYRITMKDFGISRGKYDRIIKNAKNGLYSGFCVFENKIRDSNKNIIRIDKVNYRINVEPIISEELYNKINSK